MKPLKPCLVAGCPNLHRLRGPRCPHCQRVWDRHRNHRRTQYQGTWEATRDRARKLQPWCSACGAGADLTLDHDTGLVLCRSCNSSRRRNAVQEP